MDPISVAVTVFGLMKAIISWIDHTHDENKFPRLRQIISDIHDILAPLTDPVNSSALSHRSVTTAIQSLQDVLHATEQDLRLWQHSNGRKFFAFLAPAKVASKLKDDEARLSHHLIILIGAISISGYTSSKSNGSPADDKISKDLFALEGITNKEIREFWRDYVGAKISFISSEDFFHRLQLWLKKDIDLSTRKRLLWRLDEFGSNGITPTDLQQFLGDSSLEDIIEKHYSGDPLFDFTPLGDNLSYETLFDPNPLPKSEFSFNLPLLIWVDDNPSNNTYEVEYARSQGLNVIELPSTSLAKALVDSNEEFLRANDSPSRVRFISDNFRFEGDKETMSESYGNPKAGGDLLRFLRGRQYGFCFLVYTGPSVVGTSYVQQYDAGSTSSSTVCLRYIHAFARGSTEDSSWRGYMV